MMTNLLETANTSVMLSLQQANAVVAETVALWREYTIAIGTLRANSQKAWEMYLAPQSVTKKSQRVKMGHIARTIEAVHSFQHNTTFPSDERFFKGTAQNDYARAFLDLYETWAITNMAESGTIEAFFNHRKRAMIDGTACLAVPFTQKRCKKVRYEQPVLIIPADKPGEAEIKLTLNGLPPVRFEDANGIEWEGTEAISLDFSDWRVDPMASCLDDSPFLRRWYEPLWKVKKQFPAYEGLSCYHHVVEKSQATASLLNNYSIGLSEAEGKENVLLMLRYDDFVIDGIVYENHVALIANDSELLSLAPNPYDHGKKPYIITPYIPVPGSIYGKSLIADAVSSAEAIDEAVAHILDVMSWAASPVFLKNIQDEAVKAQGEIRIEPGLHIPVTRPDAYSQLPINVSNLGVLSSLIQLLESNIRETTGASPMFTGDDYSGRGNVTAFQISAHLQGSNNRFQSLMSFFNNATLEPFMRMKWSNDQQFLSQPYAISGFDRVLYPDTIKQMNVSWNITAGTATVQRNQELTNMKALIDMMPVLLENGLVQLKPGQLELDHKTFLKRFFVKAGLPEIDTFLQNIESNVDDSFETTTS